MTDSTAIPAPARRGGGRPTRSEAVRLDTDIRDAALHQFLEHGYEGASMEAIATTAGTTKATLYARYPSKEAIFLATLDWALTRKDWPVREPPPPDLEDLEGALRAIAKAAERRALDPSMVKLSRIAVAQAERFPDLARQSHAHPTRPRQSMVVALLEHHAATGAIVLREDPEVIAELFLGTVSSVPARLASFGVQLDRKSQARHTEAAIQIFLRALRPD
jgi:AcrR family transcriptional regulator